jgi:hypothetical protein
MLSRYQVHALREKGHPNYWCFRYLWYINGVFFREGVCKAEQRLLVPGTKQDE